MVDITMVNGGYNGYYGTPRENLLFLWPFSIAFCKITGRSSTHLGIPSDVSSAPWDNPPLIFCQFSHENTKKTREYRGFSSLTRLITRGYPWPIHFPMRNRASLWEPYGNGINHIIGGTRKEFQQQIVIL